MITLFSAFSKRALRSLMVTCLQHTEVLLPAGAQGDGDGAFSGYGFAEYIPGLRVKEFQYIRLLIRVIEFIQYRAWYMWFECSFMEPCTLNQMHSGFSGSVKLIGAAILMTSRWKPGPKRPSQLSETTLCRQE